MQAANAEAIELTSRIGGTESFAWKCIGLFERLLAGVLLIPLLPVMIFVALTVRILSGKSPLVAHRRVGQWGRPIWVLKFRTMWAKESAPESTFLIERLAFSETETPLAKASNDPRVRSRFARFCRRYSIDELPQLWQVANGEMALVSPRPLTAAELETHYGSDAEWVLARKPGLSGLWQVSGRSRLTYSQRRRLDMFMLRKWSVPLYLKILATTMPRVLSGKDAW